MFNINKIYSDLTGNRFLCDYLCKSEQEAKYIEASYLASVRSHFPPAYLYTKGNKLILDTPNKEKTIELALMLNKALKK